MWLLAVAVLALAASVPVASAHQVDSVGPYRLQIGWIQEPAVSGAPNGIELYVSPLEPGADPTEQEFADGIAGLHKDLVIQLILDGESIRLPLRPDHDVPGRYIALVQPTADGYYQVNVIGSIGDTQVSKSLHAPRVENAEYLLFPPPPEDPILAEHMDIQDQISGIRQELSSAPGPAISYAALAAAAAAIAASAVALVRSGSRRT